MQLLRQRSPLESMSMALANERAQMDDAPTSLLAPDEPKPVTVTNEGGRSPFVMVADHAGKYLPRRLQMLGLQRADCERHIAWDIGAGAVSCLIGDVLGAVVIRQNYSRLVIDCNRMPGSETSVVELSELTTVPGNRGLSKVQMEARVREIFQPYHDRIAGELDRRRQAGRPTALIAVHSFTPVFKAIVRPWHVGVLYNRDPRSRRTAPAASCGNRNSPGPYHGRSWPTPVGGLVRPIAAAGISTTDLQPASR